MPKWCNNFYKLEVFIEHIPRVERLLDAVQLQSISADAHRTRATTSAVFVHTRTKVWE